MSTKKTVKKVNDLFIAVGIDTHGDASVMEVEYAELHCGLKDIASSLDDVVATAKELTNENDYQIVETIVYKLVPVKKITRANVVVEDI